MPPLKHLGKTFLRAWLGPSVVVVSGLPRSGTSLMMGMLKAGGLPLLEDGIRKADLDNPKGYYELERVKNLSNDEDKSWLEQAQGRAVKVISELLPALPQGFFYQIIFMTRNLDEIIASQNKMLAHRGSPPDSGSEARIRELLENHLRKIHGWLDRQSNFEVLDMNYRRILDDPVNRSLEVKRFLRRRLDEERMAQVVDPNLYRNRAKRLPRRDSL